MAAKLTLLSALCPVFVRCFEYPSARCERAVRLVSLTARPGRTMGASFLRVVFKKLRTGSSARSSHSRARPYVFPPWSEQAQAM